MKAACAVLQMIYEKNQSLKRSGDRRQEALEEQKGRYQSNQLGNRESHAEQLLVCLAGTVAAITLELYRHWQRTEKGLAFLFLYWNGIACGNMVKNKTLGRKE